MASSHTAGFFQPRGDSFSKLKRKKESDTWSHIKDRKEIKKKKKDRKEQIMGQPLSRAPQTESYPKPSMRKKIRRIGDRMLASGEGGWGGSR